MERAVATPPQTILVKPLGPESLDEFLGFFDGDTFSDDAWWAGCYCNFYESLTHPAESRETVRARVRRAS